MGAVVPKARPVQGVGGRTITIDPAHIAWIALYVATGTMLRGMCQSAATEMLEVFPTLRLVRGTVVGVDSPDTYPVRADEMNPEDGHWWLETAAGDIVDPTAGQFDGPVAYKALLENTAHLLPTGKCMECGFLCYDGRSFCDDECAETYRKACG